MTDVDIDLGISWEDQAAPLSDAELIVDVRGGNLRAFGTLYQRHVSAARRLALLYVRNADDADDVVADAFARVLRVLRSGSGPSHLFRAYLFTVVRNDAIQFVRQRRRIEPTDDDGAFESAIDVQESPEDPALAVLERTMVSRAYNELPERWRAVLWYKEVERYTPAQIAPLLDMTPNGVSALAMRAREALRVGYLQQHLPDLTNDDCRTANQLLGKYVYGTIPGRQGAKVDAHLEVCDSCRGLVLELNDVADGMRGVVAPLAAAAAGTGMLHFGGGAVAGGAVAGGAVAGGAVAGGAVAGGAAAGGAAAGGAATTALATSAGALAGVNVGSLAGATAVAMAGAVAAITALAVAPGDVSTPAPVSVVAAPVIASPPSLTAAALEFQTPTLVPGSPADLTMGYASAGILDARVTQSLEFQVVNTGDRTAVGTTVRLVLAPGLTQVAPAAAPAESASPSVSPAPTPSPSVTSVIASATASPVANVVPLAPVPAATASPAVSTTSAPASGVTTGAATASVCVPSATVPNAVVCRLGDIPGGETAEFALDVVARSGGEYDIAGTLWAQDLDPEPLDLPAAAVRAYGAELTAGVGAIEVANPGVGNLPVAVTNSGDQPVPQGWSVTVSVPAGLEVEDAGTGGLHCTAVPESTAVTCTAAAPMALAPGDSVTGAVRVLAPDTTTIGTVTAKAVPGRVNRVVADAGTIIVRPAWEGATSAPVTAACAATGSLTTADAVVRGTFHNTTSQSVVAELAAAGASAATPTLAPGESAEVTVHDGVRIPAGTATWTLTTTVAGRDYQTTVPGGDISATECTVPDWATATSLEVRTVDGRLQLVGTITNQAADAMTVALSAAGLTSQPVDVAAGDTATVTIDTGAQYLAAGVATFNLSRWTADVDGDVPPAAVAQAANPPTVAYADAGVPPAPQNGGSDGSAGGCHTDDASCGDFWNGWRHDDDTPRESTGHGAWTGQGATANQSSSTRGSRWDGTSGYGDSRQGNSGHTGRGHTSGHHR